MVKHSAECKNIFAHHAYDRVLIFKMHKELIKLNKLRRNNIKRLKKSTATHQISHIDGQ